MAPPPNSSESAAMRPVVEAIPRKKVAIFIVTYNAVKTLRQVLDRIPENVWDRVDEVFVFDDGSQKDRGPRLGRGADALHLARRAIESETSSNVRRITFSAETVGFEAPSPFDPELQVRI